MAGRPASVLRAKSAAMSPSSSPRVALMLTKSGIEVGFAARGLFGRGAGATVSASRPYEVIVAVSAMTELMTVATTMSAMTRRQRMHSFDGRQPRVSC